MPIALAALAAALAQATTAPAAAPAPDPATVEAIVVTAGARVAGDMKQGVLNYPSTFFTVMRPSTAFDMITWLPGFSLEDTRDVRGLEGSTGNVLIDGKPPTSKTDTLASVLRRIPSEQVERVDLIVGGAPGINMRGRNIIANVILKTKGAPRQVVTLHSFLDSRQRVSPQLTVTANRKWGERKLEGGFEVARNIAIFPGYGYGDYVRRDSAGAVLFAADSDVFVEGPTVKGNATYEAPLAGGRFRINGAARYYGTQFREHDTLTTAPDEIDVTNDQGFLNSEVGLRWERDFGRRTLELQALQGRTDYSSENVIRRPPTPSTFSIDSLYLESVLRAVLRWKRDETLTLEGFAEAALNTGDTDSSATNNGAPIVLPTARVGIREKRAETGGTLTWKPSGKFSLDLAMKVETSELTASRDVVAERSYTFAKPRVALSWSPGAKTQVRLRLEHEVGQIAFGNFLNFNEYFSGQVQVGNPDIVPERAFVAEAVIQRSLWSGGDLSLTLRHKALRDLIDATPLITDAGLFSRVNNIGDGEQNDIVVSFTLPLKALGLTGAIVKGSASAFEMKVTDPTTGRIRPISGEEARAAELHFTQDFPVSRINWGIDAFYRGPSTLYRPFGYEAIDEWLHANVFVERRFGEATSLRLEVQNLPARRVRQTVAAFTGLRDASALNYVDEKRLTNGPILFVRLRRTLN